MELTTRISDNLKPQPNENALGFGQFFSDHMFNMDYNPEQGWHNPRIEPYHPIEMDPATIVLHYGQAIFEGLKAYKTESGNIQFFRPDENFKRLNRSCKILCIPTFDGNFMLDALKKLVQLETKWVPSADGTSLYIRPTIYGSDPFLGVRASNTYRFFIILSPVGAYYPEGFNPIKIWVTNNHVRAVKGGVGEAKTAGNYAASLFAGDEAHKRGYTQVLWLDGIERKYIEEVGAMNIFFKIDDELITPELSGSILPGITRKSVLDLAKSWDLKVTERKISIDEVMEAYKAGKLQEVFGTGTAAVISPVGEINYNDNLISIGNGQVGPLSQKLYDNLTAIQYGKTKDPFGWVEPLG